MLLQFQAVHRRNLIQNVVCILSGRFICVGQRVSVSGTVHRITNATSHDERSMVMIMRVIVAVVRVGIVIVGLSVGDRSARNVTFR